MAEEKMFYRIGEVAEMLKENISTVRFWTNNYPALLKPKRNGKNNRLYTPADIERLRQIQQLRRSDGLSIAGARKKIHREGNAALGDARLIASLKKLREELVEIKEAL